MKKLMVVLAAVAMAASVQAASVSWTCTYVTEGASDVSGIAYFVNAATLDRADMLALQGKGATAISDALSGSYSYTGSDGTFSVKKANAVSNASLGLTDSTATSAYLVIFDTATITDASKFWVTEVKSFDTLAGADDVVQVKWGDQSDAIAAAGANAWSSASAVPEPTSGLLMLVGLAGLALRRRRA